MTFRQSLKANLKIYCRYLICVFQKTFSCPIKLSTYGGGTLVVDEVGGMRSEEMQKEAQFFMMFKACLACSLPSTEISGPAVFIWRLCIDNALQFLKLLHKKSNAKFWQSIGKFSSKVCNKTNVLFYNKPLNYLMTSSIVFWMMHYSWEFRTSHCKVSHWVDTWYRAMPVPDLLCPPTTKLSQSE